MIGMASADKNKEPIHVIDEVASPPASMTTKMWCGAAAIELFDGNWSPDLDFFWERDAASSTCAACREALAKAGRL